MLIYFTWLALYVWLPIFIIWITHPKLIWQYKKTLGFCLVGSLLVSVPWDVWATQTNAWSFPATSVIGIFIYNLPVEEFFFITCVTLLIASMALVLRHHFGRYFMEKVAG